MRVECGEICYDTGIDSNRAGRDAREVAVRTDWATRASLGGAVVGAATFAIRCWPTLSTSANSWEQRKRKKMQGSAIAHAAEAAAQAGQLIINL